MLIDKFTIILLIGIWIFVIIALAFLYVKMHKKLQSWKSLNILIIYTVIASGAVISSRLISNSVEIFPITMVPAFSGIGILFTLGWCVLFEGYRKKYFPIELDEKVKSLLIFLPIFAVLLIAFFLVADRSNPV